MTGKPTDSAPWEDPCASIHGIIAAAQEPRRFGAAHEMIVPVSLLSAVVAEMIQTRLQRDAARCEICERDPRNSQQAQQHAIQRGWDCFKETL